MRAHIKRVLPLKLNMNVKANVSTTNESVKFVELPVVENRNAMDTVTPHVGSKLVRQVIVMR